MILVYLTNTDFLYEILYCQLHLNFKIFFMKIIKYIESKHIFKEFL